MKKRNKIIPYLPMLRERARYLRKHSTFSEILLWQRIKKKMLGVEFHRQVPIDAYIVDFYCHEIQLAIEVDGTSHDNKQEYDARRQAKLEGFGVHFIRFTVNDVMKKMDKVLEKLKERIEELKRIRG